MTDRPRRVLVVDDDEAVRRTVIEALEAEGYEAAEAADWRGISALVRGDWGAFDLVVMDIGLPGVGGLDLARYIAEAKPSPAVLFWSGREELASIARRDGREFVPKGPDLGPLLESVRRAIDERAARVAAAL